MRHAQLAERSTATAVSGVGRITDKVCQERLEATAVAARAQSAEGAVESVVVSITT